MKKLLFLITILTSFWMYSQESISDVPKIVIKVPLGETVILNNGSVKFVEVLEDSRCPVYTTCVWGGRARVLVEIKANNEESFQKTLLFGKLLTGETKDNVLFTTEENIVKGIDLFPLPTLNTEEEKEPFVLMIYIEKK